jgi:cell wall-associated NlpC family hydrolase
MPRRSHGPHRRAAWSSRRYVTVALALGLALATSAAIALPASASPQNDLAAKTAQAKRLESQIQANYDKQSALDEQLVEAQNAVAKAQTDIATAQHGIDQAEAQARVLRAHLGSRAATLYMGAGNADPFQIDATDVRELGSRAQYSAAAAEQDSRLLGKLRDLEDELQAQRKDLEKQKAAAQARQRDVDASRKDLEKATAQQKNLLASVKGDMANLVAKIQRERQAAAEAEMRAAVERAAAARRAASSSPAPIGQGVTVDPSTIPAPSAGAQAAVAYAYAQLGKPYQYAGTGPGSYDCSGLTMMAWAQGGVSMAHGSQSQYLSFPKVPIDQLQPGDLVFFGSSGPTNHHVGIVVGGGMMIDAPHTGAFVEKVSYYRGDLVPLGVRP